MNEKNNLSRAMERLGAFGKLFMDYEGCPRGQRGRSFAPVEQEVLMMDPITDVDGGVWIPVNADALQELVAKYTELRDSRAADNSESKINDSGMNAGK